MTNRVDAAVDAMKPAGSSAEDHLIRGQTACAEFVQRKDAPVIGGPVRDARVWSIIDFPGHRPGNSMFGDGHAHTLPSVPSLNNTHVWQISDRNAREAWIS
jgi:hypothetical protein